MSSWPPHLAWHLAYLHNASGETCSHDTTCFDVCCASPISMCMTESVPDWMQQCACLCKRYIKMRSSSYLQQCCQASQLVEPLLCCRSARIEAGQPAVAGDQHELTRWRGRTFASRGWRWRWALCPSSRRGRGWGRAALAAWRRRRWAALAAWRGRRGWRTFDPTWGWRWGGRWTPDPTWGRWWGRWWGWKRCCCRDMGWGHISASLYMRLSFAKIVCSSRFRRRSH